MFLRRLCARRGGWGGGGGFGGARPPPKFALALGKRAAWSVLAGGGIGLVWTLYMALVFFKHGLTHGVALSPLSVLAGWLFKVVVTIGLLVIAFRSRAFAPLPLLAGLFGTMVAYWAWFALRVRNAGE